jgi:alpha,alpha-trehalase
VTSKAFEIRDLAIIGDRCSSAVVARDGTILWYCPTRFNRPSLFAALLDAHGGAWSVELPGGVPSARRYLDESGILETCLRASDGELIITDWMPISCNAPRGLICRQFSAAPADTRITLEPRPDYARRKATLTLEGEALVIDGTYHLYASHSLTIEADTAVFTLPKGEAGWAVLSDMALAVPTRADLEQWLAATCDHWRTVAGHTWYSGPYQREIAASLRAIRLMTHEETGGIIAAATTSLPEVVGGSSNWDYRYVWLRDAGMIVSALTRLESDLTEGERYLDFICSLRGSSRAYPMAVFTTLDGKPAPRQEILNLAGYLGSRPVRIGNNARDQIQLDAFGNVLLTAKLIYQRTDERPHWDTVEQIAEFLVAHWHEPDHGLWEETTKYQYTSSKAIAACALDSVAAFSATRPRLSAGRQPPGKSVPLYRTIASPRQALTRFLPVARRWMSLRRCSRSGHTPRPTHRRWLQPWPCLNATGHGTACSIGGALNAPTPAKRARSLPARSGSPSIGLCAANWTAPGVFSRRGWPTPTIWGCLPRKLTRAVAGCSAISRRRSCMLPSSVPLLT